MHRKIAHDADGNEVASVVKKGLGVYPRMAEDALYAVQTKDSCKAVDPLTGDVPSGCRPDWTTVCVAACPKQGARVTDSLSALSS